jgi:phage shock protein C
MYCTSCGVALEEKAKFCAECGHPAAGNAFARSGLGYPKLSRPREDRKIAGVCAGFARYLGVDVTLVRLVVVILSICPIGLGLIAYIVSWIIMPNDPLRLPAPAHPEPAEGSA